MQSEILVTILLETGIKDILKMSLALPELFDESMWSLLCKRLLSSDWDYYSFLEQSNRKRFVEIAIRKSLLPAPTIKGQFWFALLNQRNDLVKDLCTKHPQETKKVCLALSREENIYFNRPMVNYALATLGHMITGREWSIANFKVSGGQGLNLVDLTRMHSLTGNRLEDDWFEQKKELWFFVYSATREKAMLADLIEKVNIALAPGTKRNLLCNLYRNNYLDLAKRFESKYEAELSLSLLLSCLTDYYFNTGDDRGLYQSLVELEKQGLLEAGSYESKIFELELEEVSALLQRNKVCKQSKVLVTKMLS